MLKYAVKEDYESSKTDIKLIPIELQQSEQKRDSGEVKVKKKRVKGQAQRGYEDSSQDSEDEGGGSLIEDSRDEQGCFYLRVKESLPVSVRCDMMKGDLWLLMKKSVVTN